MSKKELDKEIIIRFRADVPEPPLTRRWGRWRFNADNLTLAYQHKDDEYEIDFEEIHSNAEIMDWIFQIDAKAWATPRVMKDLLRAIKNILDPQANFCSMGADRRADGGMLARLFASRTEPDLIDLAE